MANPFERRATEYVRDDEAFLARITPEPLAAFFKEPHRKGALYDRLVRVIGRPGSGKTTLARLFEFGAVTTALRNDIHKPLIAGLSECGAIESGQPRLIGIRLPLEGQYREFWEFPYPPEIKMNLMIGLLEARAVLGWMKSLEVTGYNMKQVRILPRSNTRAAISSIGGLDVDGIVARAQEVELAIYEVAAALVPPPLNELPREEIRAYHPFDVIEEFEFRYRDHVSTLRPLAVFDDAHSLHPEQLKGLQKWLARRDILVARWLLMRLDALTTEDVLIEAGEGFEETSTPGINRAREITDIWLQGDAERSRQRRAFRRMAQDMADRYLSQMHVFQSRNLRSFGALLETMPPRITNGRLNELRQKVNHTQSRNRISANRRQEIEREVDSYFKSSKIPEQPDLWLAMVQILMERYVNRIPQRSLFDSDNDPDPSKALRADSDLAEGARVHLLHGYRRPLFFGLHKLCDASSENAEQFLQLAAGLVAHSETQLIRNNTAALTAELQHRILTQRAEKIIFEWSFPEAPIVRKLAERIAKNCIDKSLEGNAPLGGGANAVGIVQEEFDTIPKLHPDLARVLQYGIAYNAFSLVRNHSTKNRLWCLIELGGALLIHFGLTTKRGGFIETRLSDLVRMGRDD